MLGGYIIDCFGFHTVFLITALVQLLSTAFLLPLLCAVPRLEADLQRTAVIANPVVLCRPVHVDKHLAEDDAAIEEHRASTDGS
jgi:hypothetical protein